MVWSNALNRHTTTRRARVEGLSPNLHRIFAEANQLWSDLTGWTSQPLMRDRHPKFLIRDKKNKKIGFGTLLISQQFSQCKNECEISNKKFWRKVWTTEAKWKQILIEEISCAKTKIIAIQFVRASKNHPLGANLFLPWYMEFQGHLRDRPNEGSEDSPESFWSNFKRHQYN